MRIHVAWIGRTKSPGVRALADEYVERVARYAEVEAHELDDEGRLMKLAEKSAGRTRPTLILLDQRGRQFTSDEIAELLRSQRDRGTQNVIFGIGPADGFTDQARKAADLILSFGKITLPHELARIVLLEQLYRAFTILEGHPYHIGH